VSRVKTTVAPASLVQEVEDLIVRGERHGHPVLSRPEIRLGTRSSARAARAGQPAHITLDAQLLERSAADRRWVIGHELGHLLPGTLRAGSVLQRALMVAGLVVMVLAVLVFLVVAVPRGWAAVPGGPAWNWGALGIIVGLVLALAGLTGHSRDTESACDRASALIYEQTMSEAHVAHLLQREGVLNRLVPTMLRTHPRPGRRREQVLALLAGQPAPAPEPPAN
jgi:hypothetical protein